MSKEFREIDDQDIDWRGGTPIANAFGDVYFNAEDGLSESQYVFLEGIGLRELIEEKGSITIGETGFGTGLNFLLTWQRFMAANSRGTMTFISTEKHPLSLEMLAKAHDAFPNLAREAKALREKLPPPSEGYHLRHFENGRVNLLLLYGDATEQLSDLNAKVDSWYLDGFAPAKNPDMWSPELFSAIAKASAPNACVATFSAARIVRDGLEEAGFNVSKTKGFGKKRDRIIATYEGPQPEDNDWYRAPRIRATNVTIIGNGIAGAAAAHALKAQGITPTVIASAKAHRASDIEAAILSPRFMRQAGSHARYLTSSFALTLQHDVVHDNLIDDKGLMLHPSPDLDAKRMKDLARVLAWPSQWIQKDGLSQHYPKSGAVDTEGLIRDLLADIPVIQGHVTSLEKEEDAWCVQIDGDGAHYTDAVILATGVDSRAFEQLNPIPLGASRGQTGLYRSVDVDASEGTHAYGGYISPTFDMDGNQVRVVGSSFKKIDREDTWQEISDDDRAEMQVRAAELIDARIKASPITEYVGLRATSPDHLPVVGAVPDWQSFADYLAPHKHDTNIPLEGKPPYQEGLYVMTGLGSKGFQHAFTGAAYLASLLTNGPSPIACETERLLSPARFLQRDIKRSLSTK